MTNFGQEKAAPAFSKRYCWQDQKKVYLPPSKIGKKYTSPGWIEIAKTYSLDQKSGKYTFEASTPPDTFIME